MNQAMEPLFYVSIISTYTQIVCTLKYDGTLKDSKLLSMKSSYKFIKTCMYDHLTSLKIALHVLIHSSYHVFTKISLLLLQSVHHSNFTIKTTKQNRNKLELALFT